MPIIIPSNNAAAPGSNIPDQAVDASEFSRVEPLITAEDLKGLHLFGIPLVSPIADPITRKPQVLTNDLIEKRIRQAISRIELECGFNVFPVQHQVRLPFDRHEYNSFGFIQLPHRPALSVQEVAVVAPTGGSIYNVPLEWIAPGHLQRGQISIVPLTAGFLSPGAVPTASGNGVAFLSILGSSGWVPEYWRVSYIAGFDEGKLPRVVNDLIGIYTAIDILSTLQTLRMATSTSVSVDGYGQSIGTPGPQVYAKRIEDLQASKKTISNKLRALFGLNLFSTNV